MSCINQTTLRIQVLRFVAEQRFVTAEDICKRGFWRSNKLDTARVTMNQIGLARMRYGNAQYGVRYIDNPKIITVLKEYYDDLHDFKIRPVQLDQIPHALRINHIRNTLENSSRIKIIRWWSEEYIRCLSCESWGGSTTNRHKIPDGIFWQEKKDGTTRQFFLEYERSLKSNERYEEIFKFYENHNDLMTRSVLYVCETDFIKKRLVQLEGILVKKGKLQKNGEVFQFINMDEFNQSFNPITKEGPDEQFTGDQSEKVVSHQ